VLYNQVVYYFQRSKGKLWQLIEESVEHYTDSAARTDYLFQNVLDEEDLYRNYADLMPWADFEPVNEMEAIAWLARH
jgi:hypothetical protein